MNFLPLEKAVIEFLLAGEDSTLEILRNQMKSASVVSRELTGAGFFTSIRIMSGCRPVANLASFKFGDVEASVEGLKHGAGFLLYVEKGFISLLEGYSYGEPWPTTITSFQLTYHSGPIRDLAKVSRNWTQSAGSAAEKRAQSGK